MKALIVILLTLLAVAMCVGSNDNYSSPNYGSYSGGRPSVRTVNIDQFMPKLIITSWSWHNTSNYHIFEGEVKNVSGRTLTNVVALASVMDGNSAFISSDDALLDYTTLLPDQTSPFKVYVNFNPRTELGNIKFRTFGGTSIYALTKKQVVEDVQNELNKIDDIDVGKPDGIKGGNTKKGIDKFLAEKVKLPNQTHKDYTDLQILRLLLVHKFK